MPSEHDGSVFTFTLAFSEHVKVSFATLRDGAFNVGGGRITRAKRNQAGSNQSWTMSVEPAGNGTVSIQLPETTSCSASNAICTHAGPAALELAQRERAGAGGHQRRRRPGR